MRSLLQLVTRPGLSTEGDQGLFLFLLELSPDVEVPHRVGPRRAIERGGVTPGVAATVGRGRAPRLRRGYRRNRFLA
jgi:hypothetical protein